jgi:hypothetical protein
MQTAVSNNAPNEVIPRPQEQGGADQLKGARQVTEPLAEPDTLERLHHGRHSVELGATRHDKQHR